MTAKKEIQRKSRTRFFGSRVDAQLLTFLVKVAALEAERFCCVGHVVMVAVEFGEDGDSFELRNSVGEGT